VFGQPEASEILVRFEGKCSLWALFKPMTISAQISTLKLNGPTVGGSGKLDDRDNETHLRH